MSDTQTVEMKTASCRICLISRTNCSSCAFLPYKSESEYKVAPVIEQPKKDYTISYYDRNPLDPQDRWTVRRGSIAAKTPDEARAIFEFCDYEVIDVVERIPVALPLSPFAMIAANEYDAVPDEAMPVIDMDKIEPIEF